MLTDEERRVKVNASKLAYYYRNAAKLNANRCTWGRANPEKEARRVSLYNKRHPEKNKMWSALYRKMHPEKEARRCALYQKKHPEKKQIHNAKRRALTFTNTLISELLTSTEWLAILADADGHCTYCSKEARLTLDHVIPLSKGGKHSKDNVVPACLRCNSSKGNKTLEEWNAKRLTQAKQ